MDDDAPPHELRDGDPCWVEQTDGSQRPATFIGTAEISSWFGGGPTVYVVYPETEEGEQVDAIRVVPREVDS